MLEIYPIFYGVLKNKMLGLEVKHQAIWNEIVSHGIGAIPDRRPFVQIGYDEIPGEELDRLLGFSGIVQANEPIGLPCEFDAFTWQTTSGSDVLLFPLNGLRSHFRMVVPEVYWEFETSRSMDSFAKIRGDAMTPTEYLVGGSIECISFCERNRLGLAFRW